MRLSQGFIPPHLDRFLIMCNHNFFNEKWADSSDPRRYFFNIYMYIYSSSICIYLYIPHHSFPVIAEDRAETAPPTHGTTSFYQDRLGTTHRENLFRNTASLFCDHQVSSLMMCFTKTDSRPQLYGRFHIDTRISEIRLIRP